MPKRRSLAKAPVLIERDLHVRGLDPRHQNLRIAHVTDLHCGYMTPSAHVEHALSLVLDAQPDVVVMTGDYVSYHRNEIKVMQRLLGELRALRVFATLGNHDYWASGQGVADALGDCGHHVLRNEHRVLDIHGAPLVIVGIDDPVTRKADLDAAFANVPAGIPQIVLCHCPEQVTRIAQRGSAVIFSGHTHGGQINVKGLTTKFFMRQGKRYFSSGLYEVGESQLYVNPGIGFSGVPVRVGDGTQAEVALFRLKLAA